MLRRLFGCAPLLFLGLPAQASDFGCLAEWIDMGLVLAIPAGLIWAGLVHRVRRERHLAIALAAGLAALFAVVATRCTYGNDPDGWAVLFVVLGGVPVGLAQVWQARRRARAKRRDEDAGGR